MAVPTSPTATSLVTEGLRQARIFNPTSAQIATYRDEVMEQLKNDLWQMVKQSKPLQTFSYLTLTPGQSRYSCPSDYSSDMSMVILTGINTGTALAATANTLTLPPTLSPQDINQTLGKDLAITGGTAANSVSQIIGLSSTNPQVVTVYPDFQMTPDSTSTFMICDNQYPVEQKHIALYDQFRSTGLDRPRYFFPMGDQDFDEFVFDVPPDQNYSYVVRMRYFVNIMTLDLTSPLMLLLYQKFRNYWIQGIKMQALMDNDDDGAPASLAEKNSKLQQIIVSQQYGTDLRNLSEKVMDYY